MTGLQEMNRAELIAYAEQNGIDLQGATKKVDILGIIQSKQNKVEEENQMEENKVVGTEGQEVVNEGAEVTPVVAAEKVTFTLADGSQGSRSAYIREQFNKDRSRQDIAKELGIKYYIVYSATANMFNAVHPENGTSSVGKGSVSVPKVNAELKFVNAAGEVVETKEEAAMIPRADLMRELASAGKTRSEIKDYFQVPYATVYAATKDLFEGEANTKERKALIHPETGLEIKRADYIRELYADGKGLDRREIAKKLSKLTDDLVDYATVWAATKPKKEAEVVTPEVPTDAAPAADAAEGTDAQ